MSPWMATVMNSVGQGMTKFISSPVSALFLSFFPDLTVYEMLFVYLFP